MTHPFDNYETVIGLECHVQLLTHSKLFGRSPNHYGDAPNTNIDEVDTAQPGALPTLNAKAVELAIRLGLALDCEIRHQSVFSRKHYFYPDLPKGYQISQYDEPICENGFITITTKAGEKTIRIKRIHIEEDAGKNIHVEGARASFVDYNRAGTPLVEVVTEPDIQNAEEAMEFVKTLRSIAMYIGACDGNMQEGSLRADVNVSVRKVGETSLGTRTETKNLNSVRYVGQAIEYEFHRQVLELESGHAIVQETRLWDSGKKESRSLRTKEDADDYRYFPDPDLLPLVLSQENIDAVKSNLPELPKDKANRFIKELGLTLYDASVLTSEKDVADYFEKALSRHKNPKSIANWVINDVLRVVKQSSQDEESQANIQFPVEADKIGDLVKLIDDGIISGKIAKDVFDEMLKSPSSQPRDIVEKNGWVVEKNTDIILAAAKEVIAQNHEEVQKYLNGKNQVFGFLVGQIMQKTKGKADPKEANRILREELGKLS